MRKQHLPIGFLAMLMLGAGLIAEEFSEYAITKENAKVINQLIQAAQRKDRRTMAGLIHYPLLRHYPIPPVRNASEMVQRFDHVFDQRLIAKIAESNVSRNWSAVGWRGIMLNQGDIWADYDGYVYVINNQSDYESSLQVHLIEAEKQTLHPSLRHYSAPVLIARDNRRTIRIDETKTGYRYAVWPAGKNQSQKPELIIEGGSLEVEGTMRYETYEFKSGSYSYVFEADAAQLTVFKDENEILHSNVRFVQPFQFVPGDFRERFGNYRPRDL